MYKTSPLILSLLELRSCVKGGAAVQGSPAPNTVILIVRMAYGTCGSKAGLNSNLVAACLVLEGYPSPTSPPPPPPPPPPKKKKKKNQKKKKEKRNEILKMKSREHYKTIGWTCWTKLAVRGLVPQILTRW